MRDERPERHRCRGEHLRYYIVPNFYEFCNRFFKKKREKPDNFLHASLLLFRTFCVEIFWQNLLTNADLCAIIIGRVKRPISSAGRAHDF